MSIKPEGFPLSDEAIKALDAYSKDKSDEVEIIEPEIEDVVEEIVEEKKGGVQQLQKQTLRRKKANFLNKVKESDKNAKEESEALKTANKKDKESKKKGTLKSAVDIAMEKTNPVAEEVVEVVEPENTVEKKGNLKSSVDIAMEKTDAIAEEYNKNKLKKEDIESAKTLDELLAHVDASKGLQGTQDYFDKEQLRMIIEEVRDGKLDFDYITRSQGLRQKVFDLMQNPTVETEPTPESGPETNFESVFEIDDDTDPETDVNISEVRGEVFKEEVDEVSPEWLKLSNEINKSEAEIISKREGLVSVHKESELLNKKFESPFKKFLFNAFSVGLKERDKALAGFEAVRLDYQNKIDELIELKTRRRFEEIAQLHANNTERRKYSSVEFSDLKPYLQNKTDEEKSTIEKMSQYDDITLPMLKESKVFKKDELQSIVNDVIVKRIKDEVTKELKESEDAQIQELLKK